MVVVVAAAAVVAVDLEVNFIFVIYFFCMNSLQLVFCLGGRGGGGGGGDRTCYKCGEPGHISRDCR